jgi:hypothetical protein
MTVRTKLARMRLEPADAFQSPTGAAYQVSSVINGFSELILELYGPQRGAHARCAVGVAELPFRVPVEIEAEVDLAVR